MANIVFNCSFSVPYNPDDEDEIKFYIEGVTLDDDPFCEINLGAFDSKEQGIKHLQHIFGNRGEVIWLDEKEGEFDFHLGK
jgi:hypothetical protein